MRRRESAEEGRRDAERHLRANRRVDSVCERGRNTTGEGIRSEQRKNRRLHVMRRMKLRDWSGEVVMAENTVG